MRHSLASRARIGFLVFFCLVVCSGVAVVLSKLTSAEIADDLGRVLPAEAAAVSSVTSSALKAHILLEEIVGGDPEEGADEVNAFLDQAEAGLAELKGYFGTSDLLQTAADVLTDLRTQTERRIAGAMSGEGVGSEADATFDALYDDLVARMKALSETPGAVGYATVQASLGEARYRLAHGHLLVAEILGGDFGEDFGEATGSFDAAAEALQSLPAPLQERSNDIVAGIGELQALAVSRHDSTLDRAKQREEADVVFDATFEHFLATLAALESQMTEARNAGLARQVGVESWTSVVLFGSFAAILGMSVLVYQLLSRRIVRRVVDLGRCMRQLTGGDLSAPLPTWNSADELGALKDTVVVFRDALVERDRLEEESLEAARRENEAVRDQAERAAREREEKARAAEDELRRGAESRKAEQDATAEIARIVAAFAEGDFSQRIPTDGKTGVLAEMSRGLNSVGASASAALDDISAALSALAGGDLTYATSRSHKGIFRALAKAADSCAVSLNETIGAIGGSGELVRSSAAEIATAADDLSQRTERNSAMLEETAAALDQMAAAVRATEVSAQNVNSVVSDINDRAAEGRRIVLDAVASMGEIETSSLAISKIIEVIDGISFQTNLLALNAGVEAARAGEAGRGFAVVASEVRALASRSSDASLEIAGLIKESGLQVQKGVGLVNQTGDALNQIAEAVIGMTAKVSEISASAQDSSRVVGEISSAATELDRSTQQNAAMFEETTAAVRVLQAEAASLGSAASSFTLRGGQAADATRLSA